MSIYKHKHNWVKSDKRAIMKVLLITSIFPPEIGGPATYTFQLAKSLSANHKLSVITFSEKANKELNIPVYKISQKGNSPSRQWRLFKKIISLRNQFDIIFSQDALVVGFASMLAGKILKKPVIIKFVGDIVWEGKYSYRYGYSYRNKDRVLSLEDFYRQKDFKFSERLKVAVQRWVLKNASKIIVPARYLKDFLVKYYSLSSENICIIPNGVKTLPIRKKTKKNRIITVGRLVPWKRIDQIIKTVSKIDKNFEYAVVGSGPELKKLESLVQRTNLCTKIKFLGKLSNKETVGEIAKSKIFVLNSSYEGLPHVLLEAAFVKTAIIAPELPGIKEVFSKREIMYFKSGNRKELKKAIEKLLDDSKKRERLANAAYKKIKNNFSWEKTYKKTEKILQIS